MIIHKKVVCPLFNYYSITFITSPKILVTLIKGGLFRCTILRVEDVDMVIRRQANMKKKHMLNDFSFSAACYTSDPSCSSNDTIYKTLQVKLGSFFLVRMQLLLSSFLLLRTFSFKILLLQFLIALSVLSSTSQKLCIDRCLMCTSKLNTVLVVLAMNGQ